MLSTNCLIVSVPVKPALLNEQQGPAALAALLIGPLLGCSGPVAVWPLHRSRRRVERDLFCNLLVNVVTSLEGRGKPDDPEGEVSCIVALAQGVERDPAARAHIGRRKAS